MGGALRHLDLGSMGDSVVDSLVIGQLVADDGPHLQAGVGDGWDGHDSWLGAWYRLVTCPLHIWEQWLQDIPVRHKFAEGGEIPLVVMIRWSLSRDPYQCGGASGSGFRTRGDRSQVDRHLGQFSGSAHLCLRGRVEHRVGVGGVLCPDNQIQLVAVGTHIGQQEDGLA